MRRVKSDKEILIDELVKESGDHGYHAYYDSYGDWVNVETAKGVYRFCPSRGVTTLFKKDHKKYRRVLRKKASPKLLMEFIKLVDSSKVMRPAQVM